MSTAEFLLIIGGLCFVVFGIAGLYSNRSLHKEIEKLEETIIQLRNPVFIRDGKGRFCKKQSVSPGEVCHVE